MKLIKLKGKYNYQDPTRLNESKYYSTNILWEAKINPETKEVLKLSLYENDYNTPYDYNGKIVNRMNGIKTLYNTIKDGAFLSKILKESKYDPNILEPFTKNTYKNPINTEDLVIMDDKDNMGAFQLSPVNNNTVQIIVIKKITDNGLNVVMKHLTKTADEHNIILVSNIDNKNDKIIPWYKSYGFKIEDNKLVRFPK